MASRSSSASRSLSPASRRTIAPFSSRPIMRVGLRRWRNGLTVASVILMYLRPSRALSRMRSDVHDGQGARNAPCNGPNTDAAGPYRSIWSSDVDRRPRGTLSSETTRRTSPPWTCSLFQPLALICSTAWSSSGWRAENLFGSTSHLIQLQSGSHVRSRRHSLGMRLRAT
jgi:hypothetical protein